MRRDQLEHAIRASCAIIGQDTVLVIGSQSILGTWDETQLPPEAVKSEEVDIAPMSDDDRETLSTLLDGAIGELSLFHDTFGIYVQGVGRNTPTLADGWSDRLVAPVGWRPAHFCRRFTGRPHRHRYHSHRLGPALGRSWALSTLTW